VASLLLLLGAMTGATAGAGEGRIRHVIHISVDGLRGDLLKGMMEAPGGSFRALARLRAEGAATFNARCDYDVSTTVPNHTCMVTGLPVRAPASAPAWQQHGYEENYDGPTDTLHEQGIPVRYKHSVFDRVHDRGLRTLLLTSKSKLALFDRSYDAVHGAPDLDGPDDGRDKIDLALTNDGDSSILVAVLIAHMETDFPAYTFLHLFDPDIAGHLSGWGSLNWQLAVKHADSMVGLILSALDLRPALKEATAIVLTADHGGGAPLLTHLDPLRPENYTIPVMLWGPGIPRGTEAHALFASRHDPGTGRPAHDAAAPPLRNGDTGNIAMALLGLPPVTDSYFRPAWSGGLWVAPVADGQIECSWPGFWQGWILESRASLAADSWLPVAGEPVREGARWRHVEPATAGSQRFFRLRAPE